MSKNTDMTMQERLRSEGDVWHEQIADHIDQLESDKAELVEAYEALLFEYRGERNFQQSIVQDINLDAMSDTILLNEKLLAKHKAKP